VPGACGAKRRLYNTWHLLDSLDSIADKQEAYTNYVNVWGLDWEHPEHTRGTVEHDDLTSPQILDFVEANRNSDMIANHVFLASGTA